MSKLKLVATLKCKEAPLKDRNNRLHNEFGPALSLVSNDADLSKPMNIFTVGTEKELKAVDFKNIEFRLYAIHGIIIPPEMIDLLITNPDKLTAKDVDKISNQELKRIALEKLGIAKYIEQSKFKVLHEDVDSMGRPRKLVSREFDGQVLKGVFVTNSTPNGTFTITENTWKPLMEFAEHDRERIFNKYKNKGVIKEIDGKLCIKQTKEGGEFLPATDKKGNLEYKTYFILCHPELRPIYDTGRLDQDGDPIKEIGSRPQADTCHNAVAASFGLYGEEYCPDVES